MRTLIAACLVVVLGWTVGAAALDGETKVPLDKVPKAVMDAVKSKFPEAKLIGASTEKENDKVVYELSLSYKGHHHDVTLSTDGKILGIERQIPIKDLPKVVAEAVTAKYPKGKLTKAEELLKGDGTLHRYEVVVETGPSSSVEVVLDLKGKILKEEKQEKKEEKK